jgi:hypothetical protein
VTSDHYTAWVATDAVDATTFNAKFAELDAAITGDASEYAGGTEQNTTVTTNGTWYAVASTEIAFTPAFTGQLFEVSLTLGSIRSDTTGLVSYKLRIVDGADATVDDSWIVLYNTLTAGDYASGGGSRTWTAGAGDVGASRKAKLYTTHSVNASVNKAGWRVVAVRTH